LDRPIVYTQEQGRSVDFLFAQRSIMVGIAKLAQAAFGSNTFVRGLAVSPNSPAALNVLVGIGEIYSMAQVDATTYGALAADTTDLILKQGLNMAAQTIATPAPSTAGYSINYLIEAQYQDQDTNPVVLPFYNSNNAQQPLNGQGGNGASLPTQRQGVCVVQAKAGVAATTGAQTTPAVDAGWTALAVVTVANGQSTVTSGNISVPSGVPQVTSLLQMLQSGSAIYAQDTSTSANTITLSLTPTVTTYGDGEPIRFKAANTNTGPVVINWGGGSIALNGANGALQGGEIVAGGQYEAMYNVTTGTATLIGQSAGAVQIAPATQSKHALQQQQKGIATFTSAGSFTVPPGVTTIYASGCAGGGGGAGTVNGTTTGVATAGSGGGGAGQSAIRVAISVTPGQLIPVTIGAAGAAGLAGGGAGGNGGATQLGTSGSLLNLVGGSGGGVGANGSSTSQWAGGPGGAGYPAGGDASDSVNGYTGLSGAGASSRFGCGGQSRRGASSNSLAGKPADGYGSGGGGAGGAYGGSTTWTGQPGGPATAGFLMIEW
jgi:hypothetical protein